jgi:hypothetical protein
MSATPTVTSVAIAPAAGSQGKSVKTGGHHLAYMAQPNFDPAATIGLTSTVCRWRPGTLGAAFFTQVLVPALAQPKPTVGSVLAFGQSKGHNVKAMQKHLRWYFTWSGELLVNGAPYSASAPVAKAPAKAPAKAKAKAKA